MCIRDRSHSQNNPRLPTITVVHLAVVARSHRCQLALVSRLHLVSLLALVLKSMDNDVDLPDTTLNRRLIRKLNEQDRRSETLRRKLFLKYGEPDVPATPISKHAFADGVYSIADATFRIASGPVPDESSAEAVKSLSIAKMITGSSSSVTD
eukprot:TRINITY_DN14749_c0_g1_i1.p1 TRINITY_DN14749_c0_g1~~TRINITY_DN14749_c0_g1_i1.p1  ORF type:complete len:152 (+),score=18.31 TRINITY_DN14749_c0_g1_i1:122-577(+)